MARPKKDKALLMNRYMRIMLTAEQDGLIRRAAELEGVDLTAWVRPTLVNAARERIARDEAEKKRRKETK